MCTNKNNCTIKTKKVLQTRETNSCIMAQGFGSQLSLLLWKNWLLQKRRICISIFEVLLPVCFAVLMLLIRTLIVQDDVTSITEYPYTSSTTSRSNFPTDAIIGYAPSNPATDQVMSTAFSLFETYTPASAARKCRK